MCAYLPSSLSSLFSLSFLWLSDSQMWQAHGLDLYIIPYGCIATGHNMGMIQVVQEAETVAKVTSKCSLSTAGINFCILLCKLLYTMCTHLLCTNLDPAKPWRQLLSSQRRTAAQLAQETKPIVRFLHYSLQISPSLVDVFLSVTMQSEPLRRSC